MKTVKQIQNKINSLMIKLSKKPLKENFGQKEIRELQDYVGCIHDYCDERIDDKWGPAGCIDVTNDMKKKYKTKGLKWPRGKNAYVFFGWASC